MPSVTRTAIRLIMAPTVVDTVADYMEANIVPTKTMLCKYDPNQSLKGGGTKQKNTSNCLYICTINDLYSVDAYVLANAQGHVFLWLLKTSLH